MTRPTLAELKLKNPDFFGEHWDRLYDGHPGDILPNPAGGFFFVAKSRFARPFYTIHEDLKIEYSHHEE